MARTQCKKCKHLISTKAKSCPKCGAELKSNTYGCISLILLFLVLGAIGSIVIKPSEKLDSGKTTATTKTVQTVPIYELLEAYNENEIRADGYFKEQLIRTTGKVQGIGRNFQNTIYVNLGNGQQGEILHVHCFFDDEWAGSVAQLIVGQTVTVQGRVSGLLITSVRLSECELVR